MPQWFDLVAPSFDTFRSSVRVVFLRGEDATRASVVAELNVVMFDNNHPKAGRARTVTLDVADGMTPSFLKRFPWEKWLTAADDYVRRSDPDLELFGDAVGASQPGKPGRRGHDADFLPAIARRYADLRANGNRSPVKTIGDEHHVSRNTAAGWVKQARQKGLLPKARRPGKAG